MGEVAKQENNNQVTTTGLKGISNFLNKDNVKAKFAEVLGQKANGFIASVLSAVSQSDKLQKADQNSVYLSAMIAASLDLPINPNLGFAYLVPYNSRQQDGSFKDVCQFQIGAKGFKQLALRSGQFKFLNDSDVREGEITKHNRMTGEIEFSWIQDAKERLSKKVVGYLSYFQLLNGFENSFYWSVEEIEAHGKKYSQTYKKYGTGLWKDDFDSMARKTVVKLNLSKNAPLSVEMQRAIIADQATITNFDPSDDTTLEVEVSYVDNQEESKEAKVADKKETIKAKKNANVEDAVIVEEPFPADADTETKIKMCKTLEQLTPLYAEISDEDHDLQVLYADKKKELSNPNLFDAKSEMK